MFIWRILNSLVFIILVTLAIVYFTKVQPTAEIWNLATKYNYGLSPDNTIHILRPAPDKYNGKSIIFVHGGGFISRYATDEYFSPLITSFHNKGYTVAAVEYRKLTKHNWNTVINDIKKGIARSHLLLKNSSSEVILLGSSAGATAGALLLYSEEYPDIPEVDKFIGVVGLYCPENVPFHVDELIENSSKEKLKYSSLLKFGKTAKTRTPALLIETKSDEMDKYVYTKRSHSKKLSAYLSENGVENSCFTIDSENIAYNVHMGAIIAIGNRASGVTQALNKFIND